jgi:hypothetical protein
MDLSDAGSGHLLWIPAQTIFDLVINNKIQLLSGEAIVTCQYSINFVNDGLGVMYMIFF